MNNAVSGSAVVYRLGLSRPGVSADAADAADAADEAAASRSTDPVETHLPPWPRAATIAAWLIILGGIGQRVLRFWANRSLWLDEAMLALNITERSMGQLLEPLKHEQGAPVGFLWAVKAATLAIGPNEWGLRLVPLVSGIVALVAVYFVLRRAVRADGRVRAAAITAAAATGDVPRA
jgi:hypothetical protein